MDAFTSMHPLEVGDVIKVPTWLPHSLQHGVRVVEFQTPTYERFIISFAQKVVTQDHWDFEHAIAKMSIDAPEAAQFESVAPGIERIARFADFNVWRIACDAAGEVRLPESLPYAVCMAIGGPLRVGDLDLQAEQASFIPHLGLSTATLSGEQHTQALVAAPNL